MRIVRRSLRYRFQAGLASLMALLSFGCGAPQREPMPEPVRCALPVGTSPQIGPDDAPVTIIEFVDFQCPFCAAAEPIRKEVEAQRAGTLRWVFKHLPLAGHVRARPAALAAECAHEQGKFWPMNDLLFAHQSAVADADLAAYASQVGVDMALFRECLASPRPEQRIVADLQQAEQAELGTTPSFLINGIRYPGLQQRQTLLSVIDRERARAEASGVPAEQYYDGLVAAGCQ